MRIVVASVLLCVLTGLACAREPDARPPERPAREATTRPGARPVDELSGPAAPTSFGCPAPGALLGAPRIGFDLYAPALGADSGPAIDAVAARLRECPATQVEIQVHTDTVRTTSFNARQSQLVAEMIRDRLVAAGIDAARLAPCGHGESRPVAQPDWSDRSTNLRVEWHVIAAAATHVCPP